jgi:hypothetical protein
MTPEQIVLAKHMRDGQPLLPLSIGQAEAQAYRLRVKHQLTYTAIARIMGEYHGVWRSDTCWRASCRRFGAPIVQPWNVTPPPRARRAA